MRSLKDELTARKKELGLTNEEIAYRAGITDVYVSLVLRGKRIPGDEVLIRMARALELDPRALVYLAHWEKAPREGKEYFEGLPVSRAVPSLAGVESYDSLEPFPLGHAASIPVVGWVQAGKFEPAEDGGFPPGAADEYVYSDIKGRNLFALRVENDSMETLFHEGDILVVNPNIKPESGDYVIARLSDEGEATFKKLVEKEGIVILRPLNPAYEDIILGPDTHFEIIGKVVERKTIF